MAVWWDVDCVRHARMAAAAALSCGHAAGNGAVIAVLHAKANGPCDHPHC